MFGLPGQTLDEGLGDLDAALQHQPTHFSWYQLTLEPNTLFYQQPPTLPGDDDIARSGIAAAKLFGEFTNCPAPVFDVGGFGQAFTPMVGMV